jgi:tRNA (cmo5U34)-methyltransferase
MQKKKTKDEVFKQEIDSFFSFNENIATVFDDMLSRSVPFYDENINLIMEIIAKEINRKQNNLIIDLGCSTANTLLKLERFLKNKDLKNIEYLGIDNSKPMLIEAQKKIDILNSEIKLYENDILDFDSNIDNKKARIIILNYTLQFIRPIYREEFLTKIFNSLEKGGIFILTEKIISKDKNFNKKAIDIYYNFKREQGYSEYEIIKKREALENVLIPYTEEENLSLLKKAGFSHTEIVFKWLNFETFIAFKS